MSITISYCRRYWKQLSTGTKLIALCLICIWVLSKAFIVMCKWSEGPSYQPCVEYIDHMCAEFSRHRISGNLCTELCHNTSAERFHCEHNSSGEKKVIVYIKDEDTKLVLKSGAYTSWDSVAKNYTSIKTLRPHVLSKDSLVEKLYSKFRQYFLNNETFGRFVSHLDVNSHNVLGAAVSGESLLQQDEYITSMNYQSKEVVPGLLGVCGNFYVSDYTPTDGALLTNRPGAGWPWRSVGK
ncbi:hypothetical protein EB796_003116 [Bugula neritina]|uniref:FAM69 N-terminal domain-containing protein n=1 Tax=Bugula neritina TaxID=10212 RepID=A0A7J7KJW9_BUGNE|nr:hypothetical protein EB796_003116 [Bugula neritina]